MFTCHRFSDIAEESSEDDCEQQESATRKGRFRITPPNAPGPPESYGRFRISPHGMDLI